MQVRFHKAISKILRLVVVSLEKDGRKEGRKEGKRGRKGGTKEEMEGKREREKREMKKIYLTGHKKGEKKK